MLHVVKIKKERKPNKTKIKNPNPSIIAAYNKNIFHTCSASVLFGLSPEPTACGSASLKSFTSAWKGEEKMKRAMWDNFKTSPGNVTHHLYPHSSGQNVSQKST